ncbi:MAG: ArsR/SmtB family transcription factor [Vicinamibacterales bacterium]
MSRRLLPLTPACCAPRPAPRLPGAARLAEVFKALSDETRLRLLALLADGEVCVCHLHGSLRLPQPTVSRHLAYLRKTGLVAARREGIWMHYRLADLDPVVRGTVEAALHALTHTAVADTDRQRLVRERAAS